MSYFINSFSWFYRLLNSLLLTLCFSAHQELKRAFHYRWPAVRKNCWKPSVNFKLFSFDPDHYEVFRFMDDWLRSRETESLAPVSTIHHTHDSENTSSLKLVTKKHPSAVRCSIRFTGEGPKDKTTPKSLTWMCAADAELMQTCVLLCSEVWLTDTCQHQRILHPISVIQVCQKYCWRS